MSSQKNAALMGSIDQTPIMVHKTTSPGDDLGELTKDIQQLAPKKEKQNWRSKRCWCHQEKKLWFWLLVLPENLKFPLITTVHELNHWSTNKMIMIMNPHWWKTSARHKNVFILLVPSVLNLTEGNSSILPPNILVYPMNHSRFGKWISYNCPHLIHISIFQFQ